jgi:hypothetical protein
MADILTPEHVAAIRELLPYEQVENMAGSHEALRERAAQLENALVVIRDLLGVGGTVAWIEAQLVATAARAPLAAPEKPEGEREAMSEDGPRIVAMLNALAARSLRPRMFASAAHGWWVQVVDRRGVKVAEAEEPTLTATLEAAVAALAPLAAPEKEEQP